MANVGWTYTANNARIKVAQTPAFARLHFSTKVLWLVIGSPVTLVLPLK